LIHKTAIIHKKVKLGKGVQVGPYTIIEADVSVSDGTRIGPHVYIGPRTVIGQNNVIHMGTILGHEAQYEKDDGKSEGSLLIGDRNVFREYVTVHRGAIKKSMTRIGHNNFFMANAHVGHDCQIGSHVIITNSVLLGGHVHLEDHCVLGGSCAVHQFCRVGMYAMLGGHAVVNKDVPPFVLIAENENHVGSINAVGLKRSGISKKARSEIKSAYRLLYLSGLTLADAIKAILKQCRSKEGIHMAEFLKQSERGIVFHRRNISRHFD
jgi:UDP-N-acetylglucosamine acyltransferase